MSAAVPGEVNDGHHADDRVQFTGISATDLLRRDFSPYYFHTDDGTLVNVHDMTFRGLVYDVEQPTLTLRFVYDNPAYTPADAVKTPVAVFTFTGVRIREWEDDEDDEDDDSFPPAASAWVVTFDYDESLRLFDLRTSATSLTFTARRLTVHLEAA